MKDTTTDRSIADTGERMVPAYHKGHMVYGEHIVRYQAAAALVAGKTVLDIASGSGYGSAALGEHAGHVYGVDVDKDAVAYARKNYGSKKVEFIHGNGAQIPLDDNSVDVVVSFETIEHIEDYRTFMGEVKRVLKPDGLLLLSTPNDVEFPESNHFHIHEFERRELETLVKEYFKHRTSYYQATWLYNALLPEAQITQEWEAPVHTMQTAPVPLEKCIYFYMICSNREISETIEPLAAISEHFSERSRQEYEQSVRKHMDDQAAIIGHQGRELEQRKAELAMTQKQLAEQTAHAADLQARLDRIYQSKPVKLARKAMAVKRRLRAS